MRLLQIGPDKDPVRLGDGHTKTQTHPAVDQTVGIEITQIGPGCALEQIHRARNPVLGEIRVRGTQHIVPVELAGVDLQSQVIA